MPVSEATQNLRTGMKYKSTPNSNIKENNSSETNSIKSSYEINLHNKFEARTLTQDEVDQQIRNYIAP